MSVRSLTRTSDVATHVLVTAAAAFALAALAQVRIPLPFTPVPMTMQVLGVLLIGGLLGPRRGTAAIVLYLLYGACGLPVFQGWASFMTAKLATFGFLLGFVPAAAMVGLIYARFSTLSYPQRLLGGALASLAGVLVIYTGGWAWLASMPAVGPVNAVILGVVPFVAVDLLKAGVAASVIAMWRKG